MARLDAELVARGIARSRERAKEMISAGAVTVNGRTARKASAEVAEGDEISSSEQELYVGRGALKLEKALDVFGIDPEGMVCIDIGASTGGFTDLLLKRGAERVYAVDVGHGQLADTLRSDSRVVNMEGTDIRSLSPENTGGRADFICADVSFISLAPVLPVIRELMKENGCAAILIKPQFEAGRKDIGKHGIVKDRKVHVRVLNEIDSFARSIGLVPEKYTWSPVKGGSGNIEYLVKLTTGEDSAALPAQDFRRLVDEAFGEL
ncbi:MAG TPA: TlyA family rRNA (cytidine-2'-O)-methyltransferase [Ruminococcus sp.]|nr:TlyA family rRNA (cytidine-2'-O)-methyltransferase [Ruminococcus sp.]